jgi:hypothetical protein
MFGTVGFNNPCSQQNWSKLFGLPNQLSFISSYYSIGDIHLASAACCNAFFLPFTTFTQPVKAFGKAHLSSTHAFTLPLFFCHTYYQRITQISG